MTRLMIPIAITAAYAAVFAPAAQADSVSETLVELYSEADEFYLFDQQDVQVLDYKIARYVRICADKRQHMVPVEVRYDGKSAEVRPGDCMRIEAKRVSLAPADALESNWDLSGTIE